MGYSGDYQRVRRRFATPAGIGRKPALIQRIFPAIYGIGDKPVPPAAPDYCNHFTSSWPVASDAGDVMESAMSVAIISGACFDAPHIDSADLR